MKAPSVGIKGTVSRSPIGWMPRNIRDDDVFISYEVQCEGVGEGETPLETGYISTGGIFHS